MVLLVSQLFREIVQFAWSDLVLDLISALHYQERNTWLCIWQHQLNNNRLAATHFKLNWASSLMKNPFAWDTCLRLQIHLGIKLHPYPRNWNDPSHSFSSIRYLWILYTHPPKWFYSCWFNAWFSSVLIHSAMKRECSFHLPNAQCAIKISVTFKFSRLVFSHITMKGI